MTTSQCMLQKSDQGQAKVNLLFIWLMKASEIQFTWDRLNTIFTFIHHWILTVTLQSFCHKICISFEWKSETTWLALTWTFFLTPSPEAWGLNCCCLASCGQRLFNLVPTPVVWKLVSGGCLFPYGQLINHPQASPAPLLMNIGHGID